MRLLWFSDGASTIGIVEQAAATVTNDSTIRLLNIQTSFNGPRKAARTQHKVPMGNSHGHARSGLS